MSKFHRASATIDSEASDDVDSSAKRDDREHLSGPERRAYVREKMKLGYQEMGEINRSLAEELASDFDCTPRFFQIDAWRKA